MTSALQTCRQCLFLKNLPLTAEDGNTVSRMCCVRQAPRVDTGMGKSAAFRVIDYPDVWTCGDGADGNSLISYSQGLTDSPAGPTGPMGPTGPSGSVGPAGPGGLISIQFLTASGTITIPAGATKCKVMLVGGGSAGATGSTTITDGVASYFWGVPGTSAASLIKYLSGLTPENTLTLAVGAAGSAPAGDGGNTVLSSGTQSIATLTAGKGAYTVPGVATNGDVNMSGVSGFVVSNSPLVAGSPYAAGSILFGTAYGGGGLPGLGDMDHGLPGTQGIAVLEWYA